MDSNNSKSTTSKKGEGKDMNLADNTYSARENKSHTTTTEHGMMICFTTGSSQLTELDDILLPVKILIFFKLW